MRDVKELLSDKPKQRSFESRHSSIDVLRDKPKDVESNSPCNNSILQDLRESRRTQSTYTAKSSKNNVRLAKQNGNALALALRGRK